MSTPILAAKLYIPPPRSHAVCRPRLIKRLNEGLRGKLTLISASAGFGKTTLVSSWIEGLQSPKTTWLSLDKEDNDPARFLAYLVAALQMIDPDCGKGVLGALQSPQRLSPESILTLLLNEINAIPEHFILILDDYHVIDSQPINQALAFLLEHMPPQMRLLIATRDDPHLPLARLRAHAQLNELRAADLRFAPAEAAEFLNKTMGLNLAAEHIAALETRTEGWIAGLQLAALALRGQIAMQGRQNAADFIESFTGSHRFVLDYLLEEVLEQQPEDVQNFLLKTAVLNRLTGSLCDALVSQSNGQAMLEMLDRANLFIVPLDNERRWYRYHHLFAELLRQRQGDGVELHRRASIWYEENGLDVDAFHHAAAANDIDRAERLIVGKNLPLHFRGAVMPVLNWLAALPAKTLDARPTLWVMYASALSMTGQLTAVEPKLQAAESALQNIAPDEKRRNLIGHIAAIRALLAASQSQANEIIAQSRRALEYLHPDNLAVRTATIWKMGIAYQLQGDRPAASQAFAEAVAISQKSGNIIIDIAASVGLGAMQEAENQLHLAEQTYRRILNVIGDMPHQSANDAHFGLARIRYERGELDAAQRYGERGIELARQFGNRDGVVSGQIILSRVQLARQDAASAAAMLAEAEQIAHEYGLTHRLAEITAVHPAKQVPPHPAQEDTLIEPLSQRELEIMQLIAQGLSNREIGERLFLALSTVKGHNGRIFGKLQVQRRTEAVARARELGLVG